MIDANDALKVWASDEAAVESFYVQPCSFNKSFSGIAFCFGFGSCIIVCTQI